MCVVALPEAIQLTISLQLKARPPLASLSDQAVPVCLPQEDLLCTL